MIGAAGAAFLLGLGRIMGVSGLLGGLVDGSGRGPGGGAADGLWFLAGLIGLPLLLSQGAGFAPAVTITGNAGLLIAAGLLVGLGTRLANGCTSGHGVCGISRLSLRGIVATGCYIGAGALTVVLGRHLLGVL